MFAPLLEDLFSRRGPGRLVPLVVEPSYRGVVGEKRPVTLRRRVPCGCASGCPGCDHVGWRVATETFLVTVPEGIPLGTKLRLASNGDESALNVTLRRRPDLYVEIVVEGPRAEELRAAQAAHEAGLETSHHQERSRTSVERQRSARAALLIVGVIGAIATLIPAWWLKDHFDKARVGERCFANADCRSNECLALTRQGEAMLPGSPTRFMTTEGHVCTTSCETDADCPSAMKCAGVHTGFVGVSLDFAPNRPPDRRACSPRKRP